MDLVDQSLIRYSQFLGKPWATLGILWATLGYLGLVPWATLDVFGCPWASLCILRCPWGTLSVFGQTALPPWANHPACPWPLAPTSCYFYSVIFFSAFVWVSFKNRGMLKSPSFSLMVPLPYYL
jgi:hypothetical protein